MLGIFAQSPPLIGVSQDDYTDVRIKSCDPEGWWYKWSNIYICRSHYKNFSFIPIFTVDIDGNTVHVMIQSIIQACKLPSAYCYIIAQSPWHFEQLWLGLFRGIDSKFTFACFLCCPEAAQAERAGRKCTVIAFLCITELSTRACAVYLHWLDSVEINKI